MDKNFITGVQLKKKENKIIIYLDELPEKSAYKIKLEVREKIKTKRRLFKAGFVTSRMISIKKNEEIEEISINKV